MRRPDLLVDRDGAERLEQRAPEAAIAVGVVGTGRGPEPIEGLAEQRAHATLERDAGSRCRRWWRRGVLAVVEDAVERTDGCR